MSWDTSTTDIRTLINDGPQDKVAWQKPVIGVQNGSNAFFKTFENRRTTALVSPTYPFGVYVNNVLATVSAEDLVTGAFTLATPPNDGDIVIATYYYQWFFDTEIEQFATMAAEWILSTDDPTVVTPDLEPAAKNYGAACAFDKLSVRFSQQIAEQYQLHDAPDKERWNPAKQWQSMATAKYKLAFELRDDTYQDRKGQAKAPNSRVIVGCTKDVAPNR